MSKPRERRILISKVEINLTGCDRAGCDMKGRRWNRRAIRATSERRLSDALAPRFDEFYQLARQQFSSRQRKGMKATRRGSQSFSTNVRDLASASSPIFSETAFSSILSHVNKTLLPSSFTWQDCPGSIVTDVPSTASMAC